jgi:hypothetical protein
MRKCFVISPIGKDDSEVREHADAVFDYIIKPAMDECGIQASRSDHVDKLGKISEQMFHSILNDDLCVAVLTFDNPNVFYELAIAQAAARPTIILVEKNHPLPFDIQDLRCVPYDLKPKPLFEREYVKRIVANVRELEAADWKVPCPIPGFAGLSGGRDAPLTLPRYKDYEHAYGWLPLLEEARETFDLLGTSLTTFRRIKGFREIILKKAEAGCKIRVLMLHRDNPIFGMIRDPKLSEETLAATITRIEEGVTYYSDLAAESPNVELRLLKTGCPHFQLLRTDQYAAITHYLYGETTSYCPLLRVPSTSPLYTAYAHDFEILWSLNAPPRAQ